MDDAFLVVHESIDLSANSGKEMQQFTESRMLLALRDRIQNQGVSTRRVARITEELCGFEISATQVSSATATLDEQLIAWRKRALGSFPYVILDARYEKVRHCGRVIDCAILVALGVDTAGKRQVLGSRYLCQRQNLTGVSFCPA